jgi:hypothetical protein
VAAADLDGDGDLDLITASSWDEKIAWFENDGASDPSFTVHVISAGSLSVPTWVTTGDLDGDGDADIVAVGNAALPVWFQNQGGGSFAQHTLGPSSGFPFPPVCCNSMDPTFHSVARVGDIDGDGDLDVAVTGTSTVLYRNLGGSPPSFGAQMVETLTRGLALGDYDGDGDLDLATASTDVDEIAWYANDGQPTPGFTRNVISSQSNAIDASFLASGDLDGDGDLDLAIASPGVDRVFAGTLTWLENQQNGARWKTAAIGVGLLHASSLAMADVDRDGRMDVISSAVAGDSVLWHPQRGPRTLPFTLSWETAFSYWPIASVSVEHFGVASIDASPSGTLSRLEFLGGYAGLGVGEPIGGPLNLEYGGAALGLATGSFDRDAGTAVLPLTGFPHWCWFNGQPSISCFGLPLNEGAVGPGVGGTAVYADPRASSRLSVLGAPWTVGTAVVTGGAWPGDPGQTFTARGFAHGPLSNTGTTAAEGGALQLVTPIQIRGGFPSFAYFARLTIHFVPEPGAALSLSLGALALAVLGRRKRRGPA